MINDDTIFDIEKSMMDVYEAEKCMVNGLEKSGKLYLPIKTMVRNIPQDLRTRLEIKVNAPVKKLRSQVERLLGQRLKVFSAKKSTYIGKNLENAEIISDIVQDHPEISLKMVCQKVPVTKQQTIETINEMIQNGILIPRINDKLNIFLTLNKQPDEQTEGKDTPVDPQNVDEDLTSTFHEAYKTIGKGRNFIRIHRIREHLNWPGDQFDAVMKSLVQNYQVELHGGDPSSMSDDEIANSFKDENGQLFLTISWR